MYIYIIDNLYLSDNCPGGKHSHILSYECLLTKTAVPMCSQS